MKTGLLSPGSAPSATLSDHAVGCLSACLETLTECALNTCDTYVSHAQRNEITPMDLLYALRYQAKHFLLREDLETRIESKLSNPSNIQEEEEAGMQQQVLSAPLEFCRSECDCELCREIHDCTDTWESWCPEDPAMLCLKRSVDNTYRCYLNAQVSDS